MKNWIEIIPALPEKEAAQKYAEWKAAQQSNGVTIDNERIRRDHIFSNEMTLLVRYCLLQENSD